MPQRTVPLPTHAEVAAQLFRPTIALVLSRADGRSDKNASLEIYSITGNRLHSPRRVKEQDLESLLRAIGPKSKVKAFGGGFMPEEVIWMKGADMAFHEPSGLKRIFVKTAQQKVEEVHLWLPAMVFWYSYDGGRHNLHVFWSRGSLRDIRQDNACLIPALLPNISPQGRVCNGNAFEHVPFEPHAEEMLEVIKERFFGSVFNEFFNAELRALYERFVEIGKHPIPEELKQIENAFWKSPLPELKEHLKKHPWERVHNLIPIA